MPRIDAEIKEQIKKLDYHVLQEILIKLASKEKSVYDFLLVNYLDKELAERELFEDTKGDLEVIFRKRHKGFSEQLQMANMLGACIKRINEFTRISKNRVFEADLLLHILEIPFSECDKKFGTCFTQFDSKVALIVKRLVNVVTNHLEDVFWGNAIPKDKLDHTLHQILSNIEEVRKIPEEERHYDDYG